MQRLKIAQQIIIVLLFAVLIPFVTIGLIISNISQQSVRRELNYSALEISRSIGENVESYLKSCQDILNQAADAITFIPYAADRADFLSEVEKKSNGIASLFVAENTSLLKDSYTFDKETSRIILHSPINDEYSLVAELDAADMQNAVSERYKDEKRQIYILSQDDSLIATNAIDAPEFERLLKIFPRRRSLKHPSFSISIKISPALITLLKIPAGR